MLCQLINIEKIEKKIEKHTIVLLNISGIVKTYIEYILTLYSKMIYKLSIKMTRVEQTPGEFLVILHS